MQVIYLNQYFDNNENLESNLVENKVKVLDTEFYMYTDNGVFNKKGLDFGTRVLLENINLDNKYSFLDVGCGCGPIGFYVLLNKRDAVVDMIDVNNRAIKLTKMGLKKNHIEAEVFNSDAYSNVFGKYDMIITNPPIHVGKEKVYEIIRGAKDHLNNNGELWIVIRKDQGAKSMINDNSDIYDFEIISKIKGFWVIKSKIK
jgi:16S rRNA (guanine1207-N2)-methyltransferase